MWDLVPLAWKCQDSVHLGNIKMVFRGGGGYLENVKGRLYRKGLRNKQTKQRITYYFRSCSPYDVMR